MIVRVVPGTGDPHLLVLRQADRRVRPVGVRVLPVLILVHLRARDTVRVDDLDVAVRAEAVLVRGEVDERQVHGRRPLGGERLIATRRDVDVGDVADDQPLGTMLHRSLPRAVEVEPDVRRERRRGGVLHVGVQPHLLVGVDLERHSRREAETAVRRLDRDQDLRDELVG